MTALIIVDIQNDFLPGGALPVPRGDEIIPVVNGLQSYFDLVVATQDWHPADHSSFASNHDGKFPFDNLLINGNMQTLWPDHCQQGTPGADFPRALDITRVEAIFRKGTNRNIDSYSGFFDNDHQRSTGLAGYLRDRKADSLLICGLAADVCVLATAMDALQLHFKTSIIKDAIKPLSTENFATGVSRFLAANGQLTDSSIIIN